MRTIEEGRAASKSLRKKIWLFSFYVPESSFRRYHSKPNSDVGIFSPKTEGIQTKVARLLIGWLPRKFKSLKF
jgi:hypothetical protein